ncbi:BTAD domain-containing putative transcriptional regulator [Paenibacillus piri]|uniref:Response regulator n=1 Tax=Paenibacillus piri TaxID=2547395 RepID=A0A4R5KHG4_9BACL|nr:BTAD domain-containing putative transcriptional regulator [Paenibacillus piri]TDF94776.1 response regulator [Paenibacillus piri]
MLRAIIVDDEELSVKRLKKLLIESGEIEVCRTFLNPLEAYEFVKENPIDIAFLDISMPGINGMTLSGLLLDHTSIDVVFVTGYDDYAVQAFDMSALDYLMKPVTAQRLSKTLSRIRKGRRSMAVESRISVLLFNGLKIFQKGPDQAPLKLRSPKTEELFAFLVCKGTVSREEIIDTLWSELEPEKAWKNLNSTLYYIRKAIGESKPGSCILAGRNEIRIEEGSVYCDLYEFELLLKRMRRSPEKSAELFEQAEALYTGQLLKGKAYEWAEEKARRIEQNYIELLETAGKYHLTHNQPQKSLHYFGEILKLDAIREDIHHEVIRLYVALGRKNEALRQYRVLAEQLQQELGTKPDPLISDYMTTLTHS